MTKITCRNETVTRHCGGTEGENRKKAAFSDESVHSGGKTLKARPLRKAALRTIPQNAMCAPETSSNRLIRAPSPPEKELRMKKPSGRSKRRRTRISAPLLRCFPQKRAPFLHGYTTKLSFDPLRRREHCGRHNAAQSSSFLSRATADFSNLLTCAWLTPTFSLISFCVLPSK